MPKQIEFDSNFSKGLNTDVSLGVVSKEELIEAKNIDIMPRGGFKKRNGITSINSSAYTEKTTQLINFPMPNGQEQLLAIMNKTLYKINKTDGAKTQIKSLNNDRVPYFFLQDYLYFIDSGYEYYRYDGTNVEAVPPNSDTTNDLSKIRKCKFAIYHTPSMRIFFAGNSDDPSAVYYSEYNDPTFVKATSAIYPTRNQGPVVALEVIMDALIAFYNYSGQVWRGIDPAQDAIWEAFPTNHGPINADLTNLTTDSLSIVSKGGIMKLSPSIIGVPMDSEVGSKYIQNISKDKVNNILGKITNEEISKSIFDPDENKYYVSYCDDGTGSNNKLLVFDWERQSYSEYTNVNINDFCKLVDGGLMLAGDDYIGYFNDNYTDSLCGSDNIINLNVLTPVYTFGRPIRNKLVSRIFVLYKNFGINSEIIIQLLVDGEVKQEFTAAGKDNQKEYLVLRKKTNWKGRDFQLRIKNSQYSPTEIYSIGFVYSDAETGGDIL